MKYWKNFDWQLFVLPLLLVAFSCMMLYQISHWAPDVPTSTPYKQVAYLLLGIGLFWCLANTDYKFFRALVWPAYVAVIGGLVFVSIAGHSSYGGTRWIDLGFIQLQPSEPAKIVVVLALAKFLSDREYRMGELSTIAGSIVIAAIPAILVLRQPDFGSAMVFVAIWLALMLMSRTPTRHLVALGALAAVAAPVTWLKILKPFQRERLTSFLHPGQDLLGNNYNPFHAQLAIGSGGPWGEWFSRGTQSRLNFLRVQDEDFIFSVIAEQIGFAAELVLLSVILVLLMRIARVVFIAGDTFGKLIATGVLAIFLFQTFINIGMNVGIMPVTGIPLPLLSYGGSSLITSLAALGILESVLLRHKKLIFDTGQDILSH